jgi:RNA recognition motif-containing protein
MDLSEVFSRYGPLFEVALLTTPEGKSKGAAFVTFVNREDADTALDELQGYCFPNSSGESYIRHQTNSSHCYPD